MAEAFPFSNEKNFAGVFHDLCGKFRLGKPIYNLEKDLGNTPKKTFRMSLTVDTIGISGIAFNL